MKNRKQILKLGNGSVMRCTYSDVPDFNVGKTYKTNRAKLFGRMPDIEIDLYSVNYHNSGYFGIEGERMYAKFVVVKDSKGRYTKRDTFRSTTNGDMRRLRRYVRHMLKSSVPGSYEYKILKEVTRNAGK